MKVYVESFCTCLHHTLVYQLPWTWKAETESDTKFTRIKEAMKTRATFIGEMMMMMMPPLNWEVPLAK